MKIFLYSFFTACLIGLAACDPKDKSVDPIDSVERPDTAVTGTVTSVGIPDGTIVSASIGPAGGTLESADKRIRIDIPAGALTTSQAISIQPLINQCPSGVGQSFRLTPHGLTFAKPATISFQYTDDDLDATFEEALRIAFQDSKSIWQSPTKRQLDKTTKTVSVQTTHFSDWAIFKNIGLYPASTVVNPGGSVDLFVYLNATEPTTGTEEEQLFVPLVHTLLDEKYIKKWTLIGEGNIIRTKLNKATYNAPDEIPETNPAVVSIDLNMSVTIDGQVYNSLKLVSNIFVAPEGISFKINDAGWQTFPGGATLNSTINVIEGKAGTNTVALGWHGNPVGAYRWTKVDGTSFHLSLETLLYTHLYGTAPSVSGGKLTVLEVDPEKNGYVIGTFNLDQAGFINPKNTTNPLGTAAVRGVFRVKKS